MAKYTSIGGQALIEGILMKSPEKSALAVRKPDKEISVLFLPQKSLREKYKLLALPVIRGAVAFVESLIGGYKAMMKSAEISGLTDISDEKKENAEENKEENTQAANTAEQTAAEETTGEAAKKTAEDKGKDKKEESRLMAVITVISSVIGVALAVILFLLLPRLAVSGLERLVGSGFSSALRAAVEQALKLIILVAYIAAISLMKDIRRVFMYHGAEHKTIFCYEKGLPLNVENVQKQKRFHPRCGTSFMILMILVSFIVSTAAQLIFKGVYENAAVWVAVKILMIPLICGLGFELLRACGKYDNIFTKIVSAPGMWLQRITTKEPQDDMIEVAIAALKACEPANPDVDRSVDAKGTSEE